MYLVLLSGITFIFKHRAVNTVMTRHGKLDILLNNAGVATRYHNLSSDDEVDDHDDHDAGIIICLDIQNQQCWGGHQVS